MVDRVSLLRLRQKASIHEAAYLVVDALGGEWNDAVSLLVEWVQQDTSLSPEIVPTINEWSGKVINPVDPAKTIVAVPELKARLQNTKKDESNDPPSVDMLPKEPGTEKNGPDSQRTGRGRSKLTQVQRDAIVSEVKEGAKQQATADKYGVSRAYVSKLVNNDKKPKKAARWP